MTAAKRRRLGLDGDPELESLLRLKAILENDALFEQIGAPPSSQEGSSDGQGSPLVRRSGEGGPLLSLPIASKDDFRLPALKRDLLALAGDPDLRLLALELDPLPHLAAELHPRRLALELDGHCSVSPIS
jgi:hypothetical protein